MLQFEKQKTKDAYRDADVLKAKEVTRAIAAFYQYRFF